jgi:hypothetical protein
LTIGLNLGLWIYNEISAYFSFNFISIWAAGCVLRLSCIGWEAQIHLHLYLKQCLILIVRSLQDSHARINIRVAAILWLSGQWKLQDSCYWWRRRLRPPHSDRTTALASSRHGELFYGIRSRIYTVNHVVHWCQVKKVGTIRYRIPILSNSMQLIIISDNWSLNWCRPFMLMHLNTIRMI